MNLVLLSVQSDLRTEDRTLSKNQVGKNKQGNDASLSVIGYENLKKPHIQDAIRDYLSKRSMSHEEIIYRLTNQARGSIGDFIRLEEDGRWFFDIHKAIHTGAIDLVEKIFFFGSKGADGTVQRRLHIKLYNAQKALIHLGKAYGLWHSLRLDLPEDNQAVKSPPLLKDTTE